MRPAPRALPRLPAERARDGVRADDVERLLAEARACVGATLAAGRVPLRSGRPAELLGRVLQARLDACARSDDPAMAEAAGRLAVAEQSLRAVLDRWHNRRSHALEWAIILLIAADIAKAML